MSDKDTKTEIARIRATYTADYLYRLSDGSFQMEEDRYKSLMDTSARLITCISILAVALMAAINLVVPALSECGALLPLVALSVATFASLIASLVVALCSQFRFKYQALGCPAIIADIVESFPTDFEDEKAAAFHYARSLQESYQSLSHRNDIIQGLVTASTICLFVTVGLIVISVIVGAFCLAL